MHRRVLGWLLIATASATGVYLYLDPQTVVVLGAHALVFWIVAATIVLNVAGGLLMAGICGIKYRQITDRDDKVRHLVAAGMAHRWFWPLFWLTLAAAAIGTLAPLFLYATTASPSAVSGLVICNTLTSAGVVPVRRWLWGIRPEHPRPRWSSDGIAATSKQLRRTS